MKKRRKKYLLNFAKEDISIRPQLSSPPRFRNQGESLERYREGRRSPDGRISLFNIVDKRNKASKAQIENTDHAANVNKYSQYCPHSQYS